MGSALHLAALGWWRSKRPAAWTLDKHLEQPCVNCKGMEEFALASAVAEYVKGLKND